MLEHGGACNTSLSLALPKDHRFELSQPQASLGCIDTWSPKAIEMQCYASTTMHWCTSLTDRQCFFKKDFCQSFDDNYFASHR
jgi:hypothetical protein